MLEKSKFTKHSPRQAFPLYGYYTTCEYNTQLEIAKCCDYACELFHIKLRDGCGHSRLYYYNCLCCMYGVNPNYLKLQLLYE